MPSGALALARRPSPRCGGPARSGGLTGWSREKDNLRAALDSPLADDETALRLGGALGWFWYAHGHALEGCNRLTELLAATEGAPEEATGSPASTPSASWSISGASRSGRPSWSSEA